MNFKEGLIKARSHIIFILGLICAVFIIAKLEKWNVEKLLRESVEFKPSPDIPKAVAEPLTEQELRWAKIAWRYFQNNFHPNTGMVNSVDKYPATTMWDTASYLMALISAERIKLISKREFDRRLSLILKTLSRLPLFEGKLPNKSYNTITTQMVDYNNKRTERGIGWSAIDICRLLVPFNIIVWNFPEHTEEIKAIIKRWDFNAMVKDGQLYGAIVDKTGKTVYVQEGRLGYEEYAAKALTLMGYDVSKALRYFDYLAFVDIYGIKIPYDIRAPKEYEAHTYVLSEPYILDGIEFGWDIVSREFAYRVYKAQEERWKHTGIWTAVSEDNIDQAPYFVYNTVYSDGKAWNCITQEGKDASRFKSISTKAVFGWYVLYRTLYTKELIREIQTLYEPDRGWYSGRYEITKLPNKAITCNTNAIILESLCFKKFGRLVSLY